MNKVIIPFLTLMLWTLSISAAQYYVAPSGNDSNPGTSNSPWRTIEKANQVLQPGDTVFVRTGEYTDPIKPSRSGTASAYITYQADSGSTPVLTNSSGGTAIVLHGISYIKIDKFNVNGKASWTDSNLSHWAEIYDAHYNIIQNSNFQYAKGWHGIELDFESHHNKIINNRMDYVGTYDAGDVSGDKGDMLFIKCADRNLIEGNHMTHGGHNLMDVEGSFNVIRNNIFDNDWSDLLGGNKGNRNLDLSGRVGCAAVQGYNLFEGNIVRNQGTPSDNPHTAGMKVQGVGQIVRNNFIYNNLNYAIVSAIRKGTIDFSRSAKIYHNVFYNNGFLWWAVDKETTGDLYNNIFKNNIVFGSTDDKEVNMNIGSKTGNPMNQNSFIANSFHPASGTSEFRLSNGSKDLQALQSLYPNEAYDNNEIAPTFVLSNPTNPEDFRLDSNSSLIDKGDFLTRTTKSGNGTVIEVDDAGYFSDGFEIVAGDLIQVGLNSPIRITTIDYGGNRITVAQPISWNAGDGVSLPYYGTAPDIGAHEYSGDDAIQPPPAPPNNLQLSM